jgi:hypothetical protein
MLRPGKRRLVVNDLPIGRDGWKINAVGVRPVVQDPNAACAGSSILPDKAGLPGAKKIGCARDMPLSWDRRQCDRVGVKALIEYPDYALAGYRILPNKASLSAAAIAAKYCESVWSCAGAS